MTENPFHVNEEPHYSVWNEGYNQAIEDVIARMLAWDMRAFYVEAATDNIKVLKKVSE